MIDIGPKFYPYNDEVHEMDMKFYSPQIGKGQDKVSFISRHRSFYLADSIYCNFSGTKPVIRILPMSFLL